jgi:hypothetical protein
VKVALGKLARSGLEALFGSDVPLGVHAAIAHYAGRLRSGGAPLRLPRQRWTDGAEAVFDVPVEGDLEQRIEHESRLQGATPQELVGHAVLVYLADVDRAASMSRQPEPLTPVTW